MSLNPNTMVSDDQARRRLHIADAHDPPPLIDDPDLADPFALVIPSRDAVGESEILTLKLPPLYMEELRGVARQEGWPWKTPQDVVRFLIHFGLHKLERALPPESSFLWMIDSANEYLKRDEYRRIYEEHFTLMGETARWFQQNDPTGVGIGITARAVYAKIQAGPTDGDDGWWRERAVERFLLLYGDYL